MPRVSIIVPVYNVEKYIRRCIESICSQTYSDWELLLVDDGSPDKSGAICDEYASIDSRIRVFHKENAGVGAARNTGIRNSTGNYIVFVDSDDFCDPVYLDNFGLHEDKLADLTIQGFKKFVDAECFGRVFRAASYTRNELTEGILENNLLTFGAPYCKLFRRDIIVLNHIEFPTLYSYGEDSYFFFNYLTHIYSMRTIDASGYFYRCNQNESLSMKNHDFTDLVTFANDSLKLLRELDTGGKIEVAYSYSYVGLHARALANMYRLNYRWSKRVACIKYIKNNNSNIQLFSGCNSYKFIYLFAKYAPVFVTDVFLYLNFKINH